jgi:DNA-binding response OmpR family regulator
VDDEPGIRRVLRSYLEADGFEVDDAANGAEALGRAHAGRPHVVLLDVMLPDIDGLDVLRQLRAATDPLVLLVTARAEEVDTLVGLAVGADDYITKPFSPREVVARVRAVLRRDRAASATDRFVLDGLVLDLASREVLADGRMIDLTALEFDLLAALAGSPGRVFSRRQLLERVWGQDFFGDERVVDVHVGRIRRALDEDPGRPRWLATVRGVGYKAVRASP